MPVGLLVRAGHEPFEAGALAGGALGGERGVGGLLAPARAVACGDAEGEVDVDEAAAIDRAAHQGGESLQLLLQRGGIPVRLDPAEMGLVEPVDGSLLAERQPVARCGG